ncbi:MAG TPA: DUF790 family protein [Chloroflexota bacterium]|nr:DUF790 family protein [Chloroflexota bacterium]
MFSLTDLKRSYGRSGSRGGAPDVRPYLLAGKELAAQRPKLEAAIDWHRAHAGRKRAGIPQDQLAQLVGDYRLARCLAACLQSSFVFRAEPFEQLVRAAVGKAYRTVWHRLQQAHAASAPELRLHIFDAVNARSGGFANPETRGALLNEIAAPFGCDGEQLETLLWSDAEANDRLVAVADPPSVDALAAEYNRRALATLLLRGLSADVFLPSPDGAAIRRVYFAVKRAGLLCELSLQAPDQGASGGVWIHLFGPLEIFGPRTRHGDRFAQAVLELLRAFPRLEGSARVLINDREYVLRLPRGIADLATDSAASAAATVDVSFDSTVEEHLFRTLRGMERRGDTYEWVVEREPEPLVHGTTVLVPDFALTRRGEGAERRVFVEVIGFWTPDYRERKRAKLAALGGSVDLVLVVQEALAPHFADLPYPTLPYRRRPSAHDLVTLLERTYPGARRRPRRTAPAQTDAAAREEWEALFGAGAALPAARAAGKATS